MAPIDSVQQFYARLYRSLYRIRRVEEEIARIYPSDKIKSPIHLSIGQEHVSVGVCDVLKRDDKVFGTYRGHALYLAKGGDLKKMMAELYGKDEGCARGKGGSMHLVDIDAGVMGTSAVVATTIPQAVGYAFAMQQTKSPHVVVCFFGDGATEEGVFHESMNFSALMQLPILYVCENNEYAIHSHLTARKSGLSLHDRVKGYGIESYYQESSDVIALRELASESISAIRAKKSGPRFIECKTSRWKEHVGPNEDWHLDYRQKAEIQEWQQDDQIVQLANLLDKKLIGGIHDHIEQEVDDAIMFAEQGRFPGTDELYQDLYQ